MNDNLNRTALGVMAGGLNSNATSGTASQAHQSQQSFIGTAQGGLSSTGGSIGGMQNCGSLGWWPYQQSPYTYTYYFPFVPYQAPKPTVAEVIALYKKEFGKDWKRMFAQTVRVEAR